MWNCSPPGHKNELSTAFTHFNPLQLAKQMKAADIVGVCSGKNEALVREHGATDVIDYKKVLEDLFYV